MGTAAQLVNAARKIGCCSVDITYIKLSPANEPVYQFLDKKRSEGKPFNVYMTAGANKFLRIYYARVKERLQMLDDVPDSNEIS